MPAHSLKKPVSKFVTSPLGFIITNLIKSNQFTDSCGITRVSQIHKERDM